MNDNSEKKKQSFPEEMYPHQDLTEKIIAAAIEVHKVLGPGLLEAMYENALVIELESRGHDVGTQIVYNVSYKGTPIGQHRVDVLVDDAVVLELKSTEALAKVHVAQLKSTLKAAGKTIGLLMNFSGLKLTDGLRRVIN